MSASYHKHGVLLLDNRIPAHLVEAAILEVVETCPVGALWTTLSQMTTRLTELDVTPQQRKELLAGVKAIKKKIAKEKAREERKRREEALATRQKVCPGSWKGPCPTNAGPPIGAFRPSHVRKRHGGEWRCLKCANINRPAMIPFEVRSERTRKANAAMTPEARSERTRKANAAMTPEARSERTRKAQAAMTPEARREARRKANAAMTPEARREAARKGKAAMSPEARREAARKGKAAMSPEARREAARKGHKTRRGK